MSPRHIYTDRAKYWSPKHMLMACRRCNRDIYPHYAHGLCEPCYQTIYEMKHRRRRKNNRGPSEGR